MNRTLSLHELHEALLDQGFDVSRPASNPVVAAISEDSRTVTTGTVFCAVRGAVSDGHDHIASAVAAGAVAVISQEERTTEVPTLLVDDSRTGTAVAAAAFNGHPSHELAVAAVTGTNGKTTIVTLLEHVVAHAGRSAASLGTLTGTLTTAAAPAFQAELRRLADNGTDVVAAEVSSHALDQRRIDGTRFAVGLFTNLTQDHLDYHVDMDSYFNAKARLFSSPLVEQAVIDVSTEEGARMSAVATCPTIEVDTSAIEVTKVTAGSSTFLWRDQMIQLPLGGRFNVANAALVAEAAQLLGLSTAEIAAGLESAPQVPGRFEWIDAGQDFGVVVDYSHTPASVEAAVAAAAEVADGRVLLVFGAAGDRDPGKRPLMGAAACAADVLYVTSDNPRTEDPDAIINDVLNGIDHAHVIREPDRRAAIHAAVAGAQPNDIVVVAGKGHEDYQIIGTTRHDFDDRQVARDALSKRGYTVAGSDS